jgi:ATP-dependent protease ClpP protease subunit
MPQTIDGQDLNRLLIFLKDYSDIRDINLYVNGGGGDLIYRSLVPELKSRNVTAYASSETYSAHAMLFCLADKIEVTDSAMFMWHPTLGDLSPKQSVVTKTASLSYLTEHCSKILTKAEINAIYFLNAEVWLTGAEVKARWNSAHTK